MPLYQLGFVQHGTAIEGDLENSITSLFRLIDQAVTDISRAEGLSPSQVRLRQPLHSCVVVCKMDVFVVVSVQNTGGGFRQLFLNWSDISRATLETTIPHIEQELEFEGAFGFQFKRAVLDGTEEEQQSQAVRIAREHVHEEAMASEKAKRLVRLNPIFQGREFALNDRMAFVLSPFTDHFDAVYADHIKPVVERCGLSCLRADDIYGNQPIIEDIWRYTNEARIVVAELTGRNPNVLYETGIAHTVGKDVILVTQSLEDVPFDLRHIRCVVYEFTPRGTQRFEEQLQETILNLLGAG